MPVELPLPTSPSDPLITTPSSAYANSYGSLAEADAYFANSYFGAPWLALDEEDARRGQLAITATALIDEVFAALPGTKSDADQRLRWPRSGVTDADGVAVSSTVVPSLVKEAQFELMLALLNAGTGADDQQALVRSLRDLGISEGKVGPLSFKFASGASTGSYASIGSNLPSGVLAKLRLLLAYLPASLSSDSYRVVRC